MAAAFALWPRSHGEASLIKSQREGPGPEKRSLSAVGRTWGFRKRGLAAGLEQRYHSRGMNEIVLFLVSVYTFRQHCLCLGWITPTIKLMFEFGQQCPHFGVHSNDSSSDLLCCVLLSIFTVVTNRFGFSSSDHKLLSWLELAWLESCRHPTWSAMTFMYTECRAECTSEVRCHRLFVLKYLLWSSHAEERWDSGNTRQRFKTPLKTNMQLFSWWRRYKSLEDQRDWLCCCGYMSHKLVRRASYWFHIISWISHRNPDYYDSCSLNQLWESLTHSLKMAV